MTSWLYNFLLTVDILLCFAIIWLVLIQRGKGADMGAAFGSGASGSLFGASGSANFLSRSTAILATLFFVITLGLAYIAMHTPKTSGSIMQDAVQSAPLLPAETEPELEPSPATEGGSKEQEIPR